MSTIESEPQKPEKKQKLFWLEKFGMRTNERRFWTSDKLLSLFAFLISVGTFVTFAYQTYLIREQQYASVMPYLMVYPHTKHEFISINVVNNGIGPAFIKDIKVHYKNETFDGSPNLFAHSNLRPDTMNHFSFSSTKVYEGYVIPAGETVEMLTSNNAPTAEILKDAFMREEDKAVIEITYSSVYDETWVIKGMGYIPEKLE